MSADKVSILETLLARVQERAKAPRRASVQAARVAEVSRVIEVPRVAEAARVVEVPLVVETAHEAPPVVEAIAPDPSPIVSAVQVVAQVADLPVPETPATLATLNESDLISESLGVEEDDEAPPSAPRLREALTDGIEQAGAEDVEQLQEADIELKTPPPESGRQEVAAATSPTSLPEDDDDSMEMDMSDLNDGAVAPLASTSDAAAVAPSGDAGAPEPLLDLVADSGVNAPAPELLRADSHPTTSSSSPPPADDLIPESGVLAVPEGLARNAASRSNDLSWPPAPPSSPPAGIDTPPASLVTAISSEALEPLAPSPAEPTLVALDGAIATPLPPATSDVSDGAVVVLGFESLGDSSATAATAPLAPEPPPLIEALAPVESTPEVLAAPTEVIAPPEPIAALSQAEPPFVEPIAALSQAEPRFVEPIAAPLELQAPPVAVPSVRLMVEPLVALSSPDVPAVPAPPVEVWASTYASEPLRGQVAVFVGHNANFAPRSFGDLLAKTLELGQETS